MTKKSALDDDLVGSETEGDGADNIISLSDCQLL